MIANHYVFDDTTGEILLISSGKRRQIESNMTTGSLVSLDTPTEIDVVKHYHKDGFIVDRPIIDIADEASVGLPMTIKGVPAGVDVMLNKEVLAVSDGSSLELTFDLDGVYEIEISPPFPFVPAKKTIKVSS